MNIHDMKIMINCTYIELGDKQKDKMLKIPKREREIQGEKEEEREGERVRETERQKEN